MSSLRYLGYLPLLIVLSIALLGVRASAQTTDNASPFVQPVALKPAVAFWKRIYTEVGTDGGLIHDDTYLDVVYSALSFPPQVSQTGRSKVIEEEKKRIVAALRKLGRGDGSPLNEDEQRVRDAWPMGTMPQQFQDAADRVRFQLGQADRFEEGLVRSGAWLTSIKKTFSEMGLPVELAVLPHVESSFNTYAYSKVGAAGMWQFMRSTGRRFLRIDRTIDERLDPYKASRAAANFLQQNYAVLQSWPLTVTAYNHGAGGMLRAKQQLHTDDIGIIVKRYDSRTFGFASRNFYACFLAALEIDSNPGKYFPDIKLQTAEDSIVKVINTAVSMPTLVRSLKIDTGLLKQLNPSVLPAVWNGARSLPPGYELRLPQKTEVLATRREIPAKSYASVVSNKSVADDSDHQNYRVNRGDNLNKIAAAYGVSTAQLASINHLHKPYNVMIGQVLKLPQPETDLTATAPSLAAVIPPAASVPENKPDAYPSAADAVTTNASVAIDGTDTAAALASTSSADNTAGSNIADTSTRAITAASNVTAADDASAGSDSELSTATLSNNEKIEPKSADEAEALSPTLLPGVAAATSADPTDYSVHSGNVIKAEAAETLAQYAEWLKVTPAKLRKLNKLASAGMVTIGRTIKLDFSNATIAEFEEHRIAYHKELQDAFFTQFRIVGSDEHVMRRGESLLDLSQKIYNVPVWLLRQYNPNVNLHDVRPGAKLVFPRVLELTQSEPS